MSTSRWNSICDLEELLPNSGTCACVNGRQIAIFRIDEALYAVDNYDPASEANVLARGLVGDLNGEPVVASPIYKQHYNLATGVCLEDAEFRIATYPVRAVEGRVWLQSEPFRSRRSLGKRKLVVIGNGMAGMRTVEELLAFAPNAYGITVFGSEPHGNYNRILLSPVLSGEKQAADIVLNSFDWYREHGVTLYHGDSVVAIDRRRKTVTSQAGVVASYDRLLFATGSTPIVLPVPGHNLPGVVTFRDLHDVEKMLTAARAHRRAVVIGGGLLGLEAANGLMRRGMEVTVVHLMETLMERQLDPAAAGLLRASLEKRGLHFKLPAETTGILGDTHVTGVAFRDGTSIEADLVVMAAGIRPNIALAAANGVKCARGLLVDDTMQTFDPSIYAVGECVQHRDRTYGLVAPLWEQARVCATHLAEVGVIRYRPTALSTQLKVTGIDLFSAGDFIGSARSESLVMRDARRGVYKRFIVEDNKLRGAVLYGDTQDAAWYLQLMNDQSDVGALRDKLVFGASYATPQ